MAETKEQLEHEELTGPIVLELKKKPKKKKRYSKELAEIQHMEQHLTRASHRVARGVAEGIANYRRRSKKSAEHAGVLEGRRRNGSRCTEQFSRPFRRT